MRRIGVQVIRVKRIDQILPGCYIDDVLEALSRQRLIALVERLADNLPIYRPLIKLAEGGGSHVKRIENCFVQLSAGTGWIIMLRKDVPKNRRTQEA